MTNFSCVPPPRLFLFRKRVPLLSYDLGDFRNTQSRRIPHDLWRCILAIKNESYKDISIKRTKQSLFTEWEAQRLRLKGYNRIWAAKSLISSTHHFAAVVSSEHSNSAGTDKYPRPTHRQNNLGCGLLQPEYNLPSELHRSHRPFVLGAIWWEWQRALMPEVLASVLRV